MQDLDDQVCAGGGCEILDTGSSASIPATTHLMASCHCLSFGPAALLRVASL